MLLTKSILEQLTESERFDLIIFVKKSKTFSFFRNNEIKLSIEVDENSNIQKITYGVKVYTEDFEQFFTDFEPLREFFFTSSSEVFDFSNFEKVFLPISSEVLRNIVNDYRISLERVFTDLTTSFDHVFDGSKREDLSAISFWNTSNVKSCNYTFANTKLDADISKWDLSNCKSMIGMFENADVCIEISQWNVSYVKNMQNMFKGSNFNGDISKWNLKSLEVAYFMFKDSNFKGALPSFNHNKNKLKKTQLNRTNKSFIDSITKFFQKNF